MSKPNDSNTFLLVGCLAIALLQSPINANAADAVVESSFPTIFFNDTDNILVPDWYLVGSENGFSLYSYLTDAFPLSIDPATTTGVYLGPDGHGIYGNSGFVTLFDEDAPPGSLAITSTGDVVVADNRFRFVRSNGFLGIGTAVPEDDLEIQSVSPGIFYDDTSVGSADWYAGNLSNDFSFYLVSNGTGGPTGPVMTLDAETGNVGLGLASPQRQLHLAGPNATFRMDRSVGTAAFIMVRTDNVGTPLKTFVVGTNAVGSNNGEFIIDDYGTAVSGGGARRMTIKNDGSVYFNGAVFAASFTPASSIRFKENVEPIADPLSITQQLQGVRFDWKTNGTPSLGFIAEDVAAVVPEVVAHDQETGEVMGMNYDAIVPILVEAIKAQQSEIDDQELVLMEQKAEIEALKGQLAGLQNLRERLAALEVTVGQTQNRAVLARN